MGVYTEVYVNIDLREDTPPEVIQVLCAMCGEGGDEASDILSTRPGRWRALFSDGSYYTPLTCCAKLTFDRQSRRYSLLGKGDIKNYEDEIGQFFRWIMPYVDGNEGDFIGYHRHEENQLPTLVVLESEAR
jgi:hypothetical protein